MIDAWLTRVGIQIRSLYAVCLIEPMALVFGLALTTERLSRPRPAP
jgi:hypothetical protein